MKNTTSLSWYIMLQLSIAMFHDKTTLTNQLSFFTKLKFFFSKLNMVKMW